MNQISELRKKIGCTQVDFAKILGVSIASLRRWEKGDNNPSPLAQERINVVSKMVEEDRIKELYEELQKQQEVKTEKVQTRNFKFNGIDYKVEYMPYIYNGPEDQLEFYNKLIDLQEKDETCQVWENYSKKLSLIKATSVNKTGQYLLERPKETNKSWSADSGAHGWHRYVGRFPAQLVRAIINYFDLKEEDLLLDPFCGSGTTLVESRLLGVPAIGIEISPLSALISRTKSSFPEDIQEISNYIEEYESFYNDRYMSFLGERDINDFSYEELLTRPGNIIGNFANLERWFTKEAFLGTSITVEYIRAVQDNVYISEFISTALSAKMRSIGNVDVDVVRAEYRKTPRENVDVRKLVLAQMKKMAKSIILMNASHKNTIGKPTCTNVIEGSCLSANIERESVSAIITSPPYGVESLSYLRTHLLSFRSLEPILGIDPYNFGGEVIGSEYLSDEVVDIESLKVQKDSQTFCTFFENLLKQDNLAKHRKRIEMMMKFFEDMDQLVNDFYLWLKAKGKVAFVIGNKKIDEYIIPTDKIITEIFEAKGFKYIDNIAHKLKTNNSNSKVPWQDRIIENEFVIFYEKE